MMAPITRCDRSVCVVVSEPSRVPPHCAIVKLREVGLQYHNPLRCTGLSTRQVLAGRVADVTALADMPTAGVLESAGAAGSMSQEQISCMQCNRLTDSQRNC